MTISNNEDRFEFFKELDETTPGREQSQLIDLAYNKKEEAKQTLQKYEKNKGKKLSKERMYASRTIKTLGESTKLALKAISIGAEKTGIEEIKEGLGKGKTLHFQVYLFTLIHGDHGIGPTGLTREIPDRSEEKDISNIRKALKRLKEKGLVKGQGKNYRIVKDYREESMKLFWELIEKSHRDYIIQNSVNKNQNLSAHVKELRDEIKDMKNKLDHNKKTKPIKRTWRPTNEEEDN